MQLRDVCAPDQAEECVAACVMKLTCSNAHLLLREFASWSKNFICCMRMNADIAKYSIQFEHKYYFLTGECFFASSNSNIVKNGDNQNNTKNLQPKSALVRIAQYKRYNSAKQQPERETAIRHAKNLTYVPPIHSPPNLLVTSSDAQAIAKYTTKQPETFSQARLLRASRSKCTYENVQ